MSTNQRSFYFSFVLVLTLSSPALCQEKHMQLLARGVGWALNADRLYWTTDSGAHWAEITPTRSSAPTEVPGFGVKIVNVFFLDESNGWAVLSKWDQPTRNWQFEIAATADSGLNWSRMPLAYPELPPYLADALAGPGGMCFVDSQHGWIDMAFAGNSMSGKLLSTEDGGRTWSWIDFPVVAGAVRFVTTQDGWLEGPTQSCMPHTMAAGAGRRPYSRRHRR